MGAAPARGAGTRAVERVRIAAAVFAKEKDLELLHSLIALPAKMTTQSLQLAIIFALARAVLQVQNQASMFPGGHHLCFLRETLLGRRVPLAHRPQPDVAQRLHGSLTLRIVGRDQHPTFRSAPLDM
jgi:hypothetical protein